MQKLCNIVPAVPLNNAFMLEYWNFHLKYYFFWSDSYSASSYGNFYGFLQSKSKHGPFLCHSFQCTRFCSYCRFIGLHFILVCAHCSALVSMSRFAFLFFHSSNIQEKIIKIHNLASILIKTNGASGGQFGLWNNGVQCAAKTFLFSTQLHYSLF